MRQRVDSRRLQQFMKALGTAARTRASVYLVGGATSVLFGWRDSTIDIDLKIIPDSDDILRQLPRLKEQLEINIELASPDDFIPELPSWRERSQFIQKEGSLQFFHYDFYAQALAKIERGHELDLQDLDKLLEQKLIEPARLREFFNAIEDRLFKYPAIDRGHFRQAVESIIREASKS